jgi:hypothetical protein
MLTLAGPVVTSSKNAIAAFTFEFQEASFFAQLIV